MYFIYKQLNIVAHYQYFINFMIYMNLGMKINMRFLAISLMLFVGCRSSVEAQSAHTSVIRLIFAGDVLDPGVDNYTSKGFQGTAVTGDSTMIYVKHYIKSADLAMVSFDAGTLTGQDDPKAREIRTGEIMSILKNAGFDIVFTANNKFLASNKTQTGSKEREALNEEMVITGSYLNPGERKKYYPLLIEKNNIRMVVLNFAHTSTVQPLGASLTLNRLDTTQVKIDLLKARSLNPDLIIASVQWGIEFQRKENVQQKRLAELLISNGVDIIVGSHPQVIQPVEINYNEDSIPGSLVAYSLGNFISNQRDRYRDGGVLLDLTIKKTDHTWIDEIEYLPVWVYKRINDNKSDLMVVPAGEFIHHNLIKNVSKLTLEKAQIFYQDTMDQLSGIKIKKNSP